MAVFGSSVETRVCLWHAGRCGSTVLGDLLSQHSLIDWGGEVLESYSRNRRSNRFAALLGARRVIRRAERQAASPVFGLEMKIWHLERLDTTVENMRQFLDGRGYRHVILERLNLLRLIVSGQTAKETGQYHLKTDANTPRPAVTVPLETIREGLEIYGDFYETLRRQMPSALHLTYENDILTDPHIGYRKMLALLELEPESVEVSYRRTTPGRLADRLLNTREVSAGLVDTPHAWMLDD